MELVEKNILPVESSLKEAIIGEELGCPVWTRKLAQGVGRRAACSLTSCKSLLKYLLLGEVLPGYPCWNPSFPVKVGILLSFIHLFRKLIAYYVQETRDK